MKTRISLKNVYKPSEDVVARDIHGEFIIIPITSGIGDSDEAIFSLNEFGKAIWGELDGKKNLKEIANLLTLKFEGSDKEIETDIIGLGEELLKKKIIVKL
ncbi:MAG: PqqD family protein [Candidatus Omnitrophica bacterium]|nr:PqqD family protein [Candidatus Omnitrophota bacterium]